MNEVLIAISGGEGGLRALERPTLLLNHPGVRVGCWGGSGTHTSGWERILPLQELPLSSFPLGSVGCALEEPILSAGMGGDECQDTLPRAEHSREDFRGTNPSPILAVSDSPWAAANSSPTSVCH